MKRLALFAWLTMMVAGLALPEQLAAQSDKKTQASEDKWLDESLNTGRSARYMLPEEREMLYELNRLRSDPRRYRQYIEPLLEDARANFAEHGKGSRHFSIQTHYTSSNGGPDELVRVDTIWHNVYEEQLRALELLAAELDTMAPMPLLYPDEGIYRAAQKHAADERKHDWELGHRGSDGSWPHERIREFSPGMAYGNENIVGKGYGRETDKVPVRAMVIVLLVDAGISGYGHRYNMLDRRWTRAACVYGGFSGNMHRWIQNFGMPR